MMYDMNQYGGTPRDRLDARLFEQPAAQTAADAVRYTAPCACREGAEMRSAAPRMERPEQSPCKPDANNDALALSTWSIRRSKAGRRSTAKRMP